MTRGCVWGGGEGRIGGEGCVPGWGCGDEGRREQSKLAHLGGNGKTNAPLAAPPPPGGARLSMRASDWNRLGSAVRLSASVEGSRVAGPSSSSTDRTARTRSGVCLGGGVFAGVLAVFAAVAAGAGLWRPAARMGAAAGKGAGQRQARPRPPPLPRHAPLTPRPIGADTATTLPGSSPSPPVKPHPHTHL